MWIPRESESLLGILDNSETLPASTSRTREPTRRAAMVSRSIGAVRFHSSNGSDFSLSWMLSRRGGCVQVSCKRSKLEHTKQTLTVCTPWCISDSLELTVDDDG